MISKLKIIPLGGLGEIGKNMTAFEFGGDIIVVDCGMGFPDEDMYGIDNFADMVADETNCASGDPEELLAYLSEVGHPVLSMDPLDI